MAKATRLVPALALAGAAACGPTATVESIEPSGTSVKAAAGPDDAAVAVRNERVAAGVGDGEAAAGVRVGDGPIALGGRADREGTFGGVGLGF